MFCFFILMVAAIYLIQILGLVARVVVVEVKVCLHRLIKAVPLVPFLEPNIIKWKEAKALVSRNCIFENGCKELAANAAPSEGWVKSKQRQIAAHAGLSRLLCINLLLLLDLAVNTLRNNGKPNQVPMIRVNSQAIRTKAIAPSVTKRLNRDPLLPKGQIKDVLDGCIILRL